MKSLNQIIKVSVIVPFYNVERYLRKSILSIINQTLKEIEIILIDDGSTDSSLSIIDELAKEDSRIKVFSHHNHGQSIARNIGLVNAIGEYIYFFDSDDILEESALEECYNKCKQNQLDFLFFDADVFSEDNITMNFISYNRTNKFMDITYNGVDLLKQQLDNKLFSASVCLTFICKKYLDSLNLYFYPRIIHEDELFAFILYLKANRIGLIRKTFFHRRLRPNSTMTTAFGEKNIIGCLIVCRELKSFYIKHGTTTIEKSILRIRMIQLLNRIIDKMNVLPLNEQIKLRNTIKYEFSHICNFRIKIKNNYPQLFFLLNKIKKTIKNRFLI